MHAGEIICWAYISQKCLDVPVASQALADHGRNAHRLADQWRIECKKAKELGAKPPLPPQAKKRQEAAAAKKAATERGAPTPAKEAEADRLETDSSEDERAAADAADAPGEAGTSEEAPPPESQDSRSDPSRPSFLAV